MVTRWALFDPVAPETWTVTKNPSSMGPIFAERALSSTGTVATNGRVLHWEGNTPPLEWEFSGKTYTHDEHEAWLAWSSKTNRIRLTDHFGRQFWILFRKFESIPYAGGPLARRPWLHDYTMKCLILTVPTAPTELVTL